MWKKLLELPLFIISRSESASSGRKQRRASGVNSASSAGMKTALALFILPQVAAVMLEYQKFYSCGYHPWMCSSDGRGVIFDGHNSEFRVWVWSALLPRHIHDLTFQNCRHLQIHLDCTMENRLESLRTLRVVNVTDLEFLAPTQQGQYLHDNVPFAHFPENVELENIGETEFYTGLFKKAGTSCPTFDRKMKYLSLKNVTVKNVQGNAFQNDVEYVRWTNVRVIDMAEKAVRIQANVTIENSELYKIKFNSLTIRGRNVTFSGNNIREIDVKGIDVFSKYFFFSSNNVQEIQSHGLQIRGSSIFIRDNVFRKLVIGSLEGIAPAYYQDIEFGGKLIYDFSGNVVYEMQPSSINCDWTAYEATCSETRISRNKFDCSCSNIKWLQVFTNVKHVKNANFYNYLLDGTNFCHSPFNCSLSATVVNICDNATHMESHCSALNGSGIAETGSIAPVTDVKSNATAASTTASKAETTAAAATTQSATKSREVPEYAGTEAVMEVNSWENLNSENRSYFKDHTRFKLEHSAPIWTITGTLISLLILGAIFALIWHFRRKKKVVEIVPTYQYVTNNEIDSLIVNSHEDNGNNECHNPTFQN